MKNKKTTKRKKRKKAALAGATKKKSNKNNIYHNDTICKRVKIEACLERSKTDPKRPPKHVYNIFVDGQFIKSFGYWNVIDAINLGREFQGLTTINTFTPAQALLFFEFRDIIEQRFSKILKNILNDYRNSSEYRHLSTSSAIKEYVYNMRGRL